MYDEVDIIGFSAGCFIAVYLTQYNWNCKIRNLVLCAPYIVKKKTTTLYLVFDSWLSPLIKHILKTIVPFRIKGNATGLKYIRNIHYEPSAMSDYYELVGFFEQECTLMDMLKLLPNQIILTGDVVILKPNSDHVIENVHYQKSILEKLTNKKIDIIEIPNNIENINSNQLKCGHVMFKESPHIVKNIFDSIHKYIL
jgi:hypothetical protein